MTSAIRRHTGPMRSITVVLLLTLAGMTNGGVQAQEATSSPGVTPAIGPIAVTQIAERAEATRQQLRDMYAHLRPDPTVAAIEDALPGTLRELQQMGQESKRRIDDTLSLRVLRDVEVQWLRAKDQLDDWQKVLAARAHVLDSEMAQLERLRDTWARTRDAVMQEALPEAVRDHVRSTLAAIAQAADRIGARRNAILTLQGRISQQEMATAERLAQAQAALDERRRRLFAYDSPPLWTALRGAPTGLSLGAQITAAWVDTRAALAAFARANLQRLALQALAFVITAIVAFNFRRRARRWATEDESLEPSARILARPLSAALLLSLLMTPWLYPLAPRAVSQLALTVLFIPVLRLLPGVMFASMRAPLFALTGLYVLSRLRELAASVSSLHRLFLLAETALALAGCLWLLRPGRTARLSMSPRWRRALRIGTQVALVTLGVSLLADLLGNVGLAELLTTGVLGSTYLAVILYAGVLVFEGIVVIALRTRTALALRMVRRHGLLLRHRVLGAVHLVLLVLWAVTTLELFAIRDPLLRTLRQILGASWSIGSVELSLGDVVGFAVTLWLALLVSRFLRFVLEEDVLPHVRLPRGVPNAISASVQYATLLVGFFFAMGAARVDLQRFTILLGAFGVGIGFGLQNVVNNFISGLILLFERPIQVGDTIELGDLIGEVKRIGIRSSAVRTWQGAEVIVPNGNLVSDQVINWTLSDRQRRIELPVGVAYGSDPARVLELLLRVAREHPDTLNDPAPTALFLGFGDSSLDFELRFWTGRFETWFLVRSQIAVAVHAALRAAGIEIPFPQRDLHLRSVAAAAGAALKDPEPTR